MKKLISNSLITILVLFSTFLQAGELPDVIENGLESYKENGPHGAVEAWIKGSYMEESGDYLSNASSTLEQIAAYFGDYQSRDVFKVNSLGPRSNVYLVTFNYSKGVLYAKFFTYKLKDGKEVMQSFDFSTEVDKVWPSPLVYGY